MEQYKSRNIIGVEVSKGDIQLSFQWEGETEIRAYNCEEERISNGLFYKEDTKEWLVGEKAIRAYENKEKGMYLSKWGELFQINREIQIGEKSYTIEQLFCKMIGSHIEQVANGRTLDEIICVFYGLHLPIQQIRKSLEQQLEIIFAMNFQKKIQIINMETALTSFILKQKECEGARSAGVMYYEKDRITYYYLGKNVKNNLLQMEKLEYPIKVSFANSNEKDECIAQIMKELLYTRKTYLLYLTGRGFLGTWMKKTRQFVCDNRRVFLGQNITTKGGIFYLDFMEKEQFPVLLADGLCTYDIGVMARERGKERFVSIISGGCEWMEHYGSLQVMIEAEDTIELVYVHLKSQRMQKQVFKLDGIPKRKSRTTRLEINIFYTSEKTGYIKFKDMGFGCLFPTSHKIWMYSFRLE